MVVRDCGGEGQAEAAPGIHRWPRATGVASMPRMTMRMSSAPTLTMTDTKQTTSSVASKTSVPWLGGNAEAGPVDSTRDASVVLLPLPIFISTQTATARPINQHTDIVGKTGHGKASVPTSAQALELPVKHHDPCRVGEQQMGICTMHLWFTVACSGATSPRRHAVLNSMQAGK